MHHNSQVPNQYEGRPAPQHSRLYQPGPYGGHGHGKTLEVSSEQIATQSAFLETLVNQYVPNVAISDKEILEKEQFRETIEQICRNAITNHEITELSNPNFNPASVELRCFGSMASGFATKASDMDLALLTPQSKPPPDSPESTIPRLLEKKLLEMGFGARLLTRTRVPIIKLCQKPTDKLMSDLLEERKKWESGLATNDAIEEEEAVEEPDADSEAVGKARNVPVEEDPVKSPTATYDERLSTLQQKPMESLSDYYGSANRLLRKLGSHDIDKSYGIPPEQVRVVTDVCRAFINGLADPDLKARLSTYKSLSFTDAVQPVNIRTLRGVFTQVEGERLAMFWDNRPLREATEKSDADCQRQIEDWRKLLNQTDVEPMMYNGRLNHAVSRLKRIASLQLPFLKQSLHESPPQYYARAANILDKLRGKDNDNVTAVMNIHYIHGIKDPKMQEVLQAITSSHDGVSLQSLSYQHRVLQLANDYETALSKNHYDELDRADLEQYISFLRSRNVIHTTQLPNPASNASFQLGKPDPSFVAKLRGLPDPSNAINKPRDRYKDRLEFPKKDIGFQCDINFSAHLGLHNTLLLRCYSLTDSRVRPMILFIKYWARVRAINTPYRGTLSSYGYVLMVLHYLINIATPFVCPNLQMLRDRPPYLPPDEIANQATCKGYDVRFWRNEREIANLAERGMLNHNNDSIGKLLRGFFEYYACSGPLSTGGKGFNWGMEVLSLRTSGGILSKQEKGWVIARTELETRPESTPASASITKLASSQNSDMASSTVSTNTTPRMLKKEEVKEIRHRYLISIEDPFEIDHNVGRTVNHDGICKLRDEFRRAWNILLDVGRNKAPNEGLLDEIVAGSQSKSEFEQLMDLLHGTVEEKDGPV